MTEKKNRKRLHAGPGPACEELTVSVSGNGRLPISFETVPMEILNTDADAVEALDDNAVQDCMADILAGKELPVPDVVCLGDEYFAFTELATIAAAAELDAQEMTCRIFPWGNEAIPPAVVDELRLLIH
ncbi:hypothetical protein [Roseibium album]|uniref:hypothetical protein n=1 Tax=Roseibium album TaxID=311410 RepID=UPI0032997FA7